MLKYIFFVILLPLSTQAFDPFLMKYCYERDLQRIKERCADLVLGGPDDEMDCLWAHVYIAHKIGRPIDSYIMKIDELLEDYCRE